MAVGSARVRRAWRLGEITLVLGMAALSVSACGHSSSPGAAADLPSHSIARATLATVGATHVVELGGMSLTVPTSWHTNEYEQVLASASGLSLVGYIGNQTLHDPCTVVTGPSGLRGAVSQTCGMPLDALTDDGVLITVSSGHLPNFSQIPWQPPVGSTEVDVDGDRVWFSSDDSAPYCPAAPHGVHGLTAVVIDPEQLDAGPQLTLRGCFGSTNRGENEAAARAMIAALQLKTPTSADAAVA
jgi:hypothetical protein